MGWVPIKCYLCDKDAEQWNYDSHNIMVRSKLSSEKPCECGFYKLTSHLITFRMDEKKKLLTKNKVLLTEAQKKSLIDFVKNNQDPTDKKPVMIHLDKYDNLILRSLEDK